MTNGVHASGIKARGTLKQINFYQYSMTLPFLPDPLPPSTASVPRGGTVFVGLGKSIDALLPNTGDIAAVTDECVLK